MKIKKPEDEKFFKDIVLNNILNEISSEKEDIFDDSYSHQIKQKSTNKISDNKILTVLLSIILFVIAVLLFTLPTETKTEGKHTRKNPIIDKQEWKMEKDKKVDKEKLSTKVFEEKMPPKEEVKPQLINIEPIPIQKTERELAKEALRQQLLN